MGNLKTVRMPFKKPLRIMASTLFLAAVMPVSLSVAAQSSNDLVSRFAECPQVQNPQQPKEAQEQRDRFFFESVRSCSSSNPDSSCRAAKANYALIKDCASDKPEGYLIVPTQPISDIEAFLSVEKSSQFDKLWSDAQDWLKVYPPSVGCIKALAINQSSRVSIHQLHMHLSCASDATVSALKSIQGSREGTIKLINETEATYRWKLVPSLKRIDPIDFFTSTNGPATFRGLAIVWFPGKGYFLLANPQKDGGETENLLCQHSRHPELSSQPEPCTAKE